jgi:hypothetical protein
LKKLGLLAMAAVFLSLLMCNPALKAQEEQECWRGLQEVTFYYNEPGVGLYGVQMA